MSMKLKNSHLLLLLVIAVVLVFLIRFLNSRNESGNLRQSFFDIDTAEILSFSLDYLADESKSFSLTKEKNQWIIEKKGLEKFLVSPEAMNTALTEFTKLKPSRLATENPEKWAELEVDDSSGVRMTIQTREKEYEIIIGKMIFQNQVKVNQYVRLPDEDAVYGCECYLEGTFKNPMEKWRNKQNIPIPLGFWEEFSIRDESNQLVLFRQENQWALKKSGKDAGAENELIRQVEAFNALPFAALPVSKNTLSYQIEISGEGRKNTMYLYQHGNEMILSSAQNTGNYFLIDSSATASLHTEFHKLLMEDNALPIISK
jgi:hypothetical protein